MAEVNFLENNVVNYQKSINGKIIEIEGELIPFDTGRMINYKFEPGYFTDEESEKYFDSNWEDIEDEIINAMN